MKKSYILIDSKKLMVSDFLKWIIFIAFICLFNFIMIDFQSLILNLFKINFYTVISFSFFIRNVVYLILIYDLIPRFKQSIAIIISIVNVFQCMLFSIMANDPLHLTIIIFLIFTIIMNINFAKGSKKRVKNKEVVNI